MSNEDMQLLRDCYRTLEAIQADGEIMRGGIESSIPRLLERIRASISLSDKGRMLAPGSCKRQPIPCPVRRWPLFDVVPAGIEIRCRSCRHGETHFISRFVLEQLWSDLAKSVHEAPGA
jgi:hypothetical protein